MPASEPIGEERRVALMNRLIDALGEEEARTLMESLPPVSWHDLATKDDIDALEQRLRAENKEFRGEIALQLANQTRTIVFTMLGLAMPTWGAILAVGLG